MNLQTVFPPMPTPYRDGEVDPDAVRFNVRRWIAAGLGGVVALGTNGEAPLLDDQESDRVIAAAREEIPPDRVLIAGVGRESTRATIAATRRVAALGADLVLIRTPSIYRLHVPLSALERHYTAIADASPVPVLLYNFPGNTGVNLTPEVVGRLARHPNIAGMKQTSTDGAEFVDLSAVVPERFTILVGSAPGAYTAFCGGAKGAIVAVACVMPEATLELLALVRAGRHAEALSLQQRLNPLARAVTTGFGIAGLKRALDLCGYRGGEPRPPLAPISEDGATKIAQLIAALTPSYATPNSQ